MPGKAGSRDILTGEYPPKQGAAERNFIKMYKKT
jgi:hypothetical protein